MIIENSWGALIILFFVNHCLFVSLSAGSMMRRLLSTISPKVRVHLGTPMGLGKTSLGKHDSISVRFIHAYMVAGREGLGTRLSLVQQSLFIYHLQWSVQSVS